MTPEDEKNLPPNLETWIDPQLEARVVAWVVGEASPFEIAELERLIGEKPELAIFKRRIEAVHGLVGEAARPDKEPLQLSAGRRAKLLETMGAPAATAPAQDRVVQLPRQRSYWSWRSPRIYFVASGFAAAVIVVLSLQVSLERETRPLAEAQKKVRDDRPNIFKEERTAAVAAASAASAGKMMKDVALQKQERRAVVAGPLAAGQSRQRVEPPPPPPPGAAFFAAGGVGGASASDASDSSKAGTGSPKDEIVVMSPFEVTADSPMGYMASNSMSGTRISVAIPPPPISLSASVEMSSSSPSQASSSASSGTERPSARDNKLADKDQTSAAVPADALTNPFQVTDASAAGTKLNTVLADDASSITIVSKATLSPASNPATPSDEVANTRSQQLSLQVSAGRIVSGNLTQPADRKTTVLTASGDSLLAGLNSDSGKNDSITTTSGGKIISGFARGSDSPTHADVAANGPAPAAIGPRPEPMDTGMAIRSEPVGQVVTVASATPLSAASGPVPSDAVVMEKFVGPASAQSDAPGGFRDNGVALDSFAVTATKDTAYFVSNTLAGTRIRGDSSELAKSPAPVSALVASQPALAAPAAEPTALADASNEVITLSAFEVAGPVKKPAPKVGAPKGLPAVAQRGPAKAREAVKDADAPVPHPAPAPRPAERETSTATDPVSTFSLHVSDVSYRLVQAALARGDDLSQIDPTRVRPEEFYNAFDYGDPSPTAAEKIACRIEQSAHPFLQQRNLVRLALKVGGSGRVGGTPLRLTVLLDTSGSMEREDRVAIVQRAFATLASLLGPNDQITLIGFARTPRLLAEAVSGDRAPTLLDVIAHTPPAGGTNLEEALKLGTELARRHQLAGAQNRVVLLTDGAANLGDSDPARLATAVETLRHQGIAFDACGIGLDGLDDEILESLTRHGDGRYTVLNSPAEADAGFARSLAGAFRPAAENVKLQVRFNPARVAAYRLVGFEQHRLRAEDFRNDKVDAAELAAEEAAVALYQVEPLPQGEGDLGEVFVRFRDPATGQMVERSWSMPYDAHAPAFDRATPTLQLAGVAALLAEKFHDSPIGTQFKLGDLAPVVNRLRGQYAGVPRVQEFVTLFNQTRRLSRE